MIHVFLGTKAQLIKMAPVMRELQKRGVEYNFVFSGQHQETITSLRENFGIKEPDVILHKGKDITSIPQMVIWVVRVICFTFSNRKRVWREDKNGIVLNHGDTFSTLLGTLLAKIFGLKSAHIESGLRSFNLFHPFPEEITRLIVFRFSDYYFAPDDWALQNLHKYRGVKVNTGANTLYDALTHIRKKTKVNNIKPAGQYAIVSLHRFENLSRREHLYFIVLELLKMSRHMKLLFIMHKPTERKLRRYGFLHLLEDAENISLLPRYDYERFIGLVDQAEFVVTDGGSNQEECHYLGKPCLIFRLSTERQEGIASNAVLSRFEPQLIAEFVEHYQRYRYPPLQLPAKPSAIIVDKLADFVR